MIAKFGNPDGWSSHLAWLVLAANGFTGIAIVLLHVIRPDLNPFERAISEYANGPYGLLMTIVFFSQSVASLALAIGVIREVPGGRRARVGSALLIVAAVGSAVAGVFPADAASPFPRTPTGAVHSAAGLVRFLSLCCALPLLSSAFGDHLVFCKVAKSLRFLAVLFVVAFFVSVFLLANIELFGLGQRFFVATLLVWMSVAAYPMLAALPT